MLHIPHTPRAARSALALALGAGLLAVPLTGCGSTTSSAGSTTPPGASTKAAALTLVNGWAKSTDSMPAEYRTMTGIFGTLKNTGAEAITVTGGTSAAGAMVQMHETVKTASGGMQMQEAKAGFAIPAGGTFELGPGANHIMIMDLVKALKVGETVTIELTTSAGTIPVTAAVRAFPGAGESYNPSPSPSMTH